MLRNFARSSSSAAAEPIVTRALANEEPRRDRVAVFSLDDDDLAQAPARPPAGREGPAMRSAVRIRSADGRVTSGVWDCEAGVFDVDFLCDEVVHILEGEVTVRCEGVTRVLRPGDIALFPTGVKATWEVPRYVRKLWFHHNPKPTLRQRIAYKLKLWTGRIPR